jgi:hypothetical protein
LPQPPQFCASELIIEQTLPQLTAPVGQVQVPLVQVAVDGQALPHAPQLATSVCRFVQVVPQPLWPVPQLVQVPFMQTCVALHIVAQLPQ